MMMSSELLSTPILIENHYISVLCIENKAYYRKVINSFYNECPEDLKIVFSEDFKPIKYKKSICFISDFYRLSVSSAVMKQIYDEIVRFCNNELLEETIALKTQTARFLELIIQNFDFDFTCDYDLNLVELFKSQNLKPETDMEDLLSGLLDFILLVKKYTAVQCFVLLNLHLYFTKEELDSLYNELIYNQVSLIVIENESGFARSDFEKITIIDDDLCEIVENQEK